MTAVEASLASYAADATPVVVTKADGRTFAGTLVPAEEPHAFKVMTGRRGRPAIVHADDVESVVVAS